MWQCKIICHFCLRKNFFYLFSRTAQKIDGYFLREAVSHLIVQNIKCSLWKHANASWTMLKFLGVLSSNLLFLILHWIMNFRYWLLHLWVEIWHYFVVLLIWLPKSREAHDFQLLNLENIFYRVLKVSIIMQNAEKCSKSQVKPSYKFTIKNTFIIWLVIPLSNKLNIIIKANIILEFRCLYFYQEC